MGFRRTAAVVVLVVLGMAPAAWAHGLETHSDDLENGGVTHRDTPAELADARISDALATSSLTSRSADFAQYLPSTWCGAERTTDDVADAAFSLADAQVKVVYAYASDQPDRFATWSNSLQGNVANIEQFLALQSGGRKALRFDMGTSCGPQYVDLQVVALPNNRAYYLDQFARVVNAVAPQIDLAHGARNVLILADNLTAGSVYGTGEVLPEDDDPGPTNAHNFGQLAGIIWIGPTASPNASGWQPTVALHEMTHNLGGVSWSAPHSTHPPSDTTGTYSHCYDGRDVMCYADGPAMAQPYNPNVCPYIDGAIDQTYDCGHDDYFDPAPAPGSYLATHWNVYNSVFMGTCAQLQAACGAGLVATPPVNQGAPGIAGAAARRGVPLSASVGTWLNSPSSYTVRWQRPLASSWVDIPGAVAASYVPTALDVGLPLRVVITAANADGAASAASTPTGAIAEAIATTKAPKPRTVRIRLRDSARRTAGTLTAKVSPVAAGRQVSTTATRVALPSGTWRLRLCVGTSSATLRCTLTARVRSRHGRARLPAARVLARTDGKLRVTAAAVDGHKRVRVHGQAASV